MPQAAGRLGQQLAVACVDAVQVVVLDRYPRGNQIRRSHGVERRGKRAVPPELLKYDRQLQLGAAPQTPGKR